MLSIKGLITDLFNGFSLTDLPLLFFQVFAAALLTGVCHLTFLKNQEEPVVWRRNLIVTVVFAAFTAIVKHSIPLSLMCIAAAVFYNGANRNNAPNSSSQILISLFVAVGCGSGFVAPTALIVVFAIVPVLWFTRKK